MIMLQAAVFMASSLAVEDLLYHSYFRIISQLLAILQLYSTGIRLTKRMNTDFFCYSEIRDFDLSK
jgi:hypothetical protein